MADADSNADADADDVLSQLRGRVDDVEELVSSLRLSDIRLSVSANCPRTAGDITGGHATVVRPRILPALKTSTISSRLHHHRHSAAPSAANSGNLEPMVY